MFITAKKLSVNAQSIIEYVAVIIVIAGVFIAMGAYYKRGLQGKYRQTGDALSDRAQVSRAHSNIDGYVELPASWK
ncbi:MAG: hypothetical protein AAB089_04410 [Nitrospirota bacterium]